MTGTEPGVLAHAETLRAERRPFVLATVVRAQRPTSAKPGDRALVFADGTIEGFVGGTCAESSVRLHGMRLLTTGEATLLRITPGAEAEREDDGVVTVANPCHSGGSVEIFLEPQLPPALVTVFGDAPIARALHVVGGALGYAVGHGRPGAPIPPDTSAVVVATHGHDEAAALAAALEAGVGYVGLIASRRRGAQVLAGLGVAGKERVHTPAGLDIGARTPAEIALSVYAQLVATRPRRAPVRLAEATDPVCGMTVPIAQQALSATHEGHTYHFCGEGCLLTFTADPASYVDDGG
ncbi:XdhC family protein [Prauserella flavalba]|uniref:Cytochrome oxidase I n=1 Tax=Prauserella flavalba TaxID=1477506 RepID=A0A318M5L7_9PSEU|nr:XdhC family protein [Prauserella flavalba]PXY38066.1 cytochrome oxidase I [Prauserella flavalba]